MTNPEFEQFVKRLFTAFPDLYEWLMASSPDPKGTQAIWRDVLRDCTFDECLHVLDSWICGRRPAPKAYERSQVALLLRQSVYFERDRERERTRTTAAADDYHQRRRRRSDYQPLDASLGAILREGQQLHRRFLDGAIDREQFETAKRALLAKVP